MRRLSRAVVAAFIVSLGAACAPIPMPDVLEQAQRVSQGASAAEAKAFAPAAFAHAEKLRVEAEQAAQKKDLAGAEILGERALAAYAHAAGLARIARAEREGSQAEGKAKQAAIDLGLLEAEQARIGADADGLELQIRVTRDAQAVVPSGKTDPERERARLAAARSLDLQARLLCSAAGLLVAGAEASGQTKLDAKLIAQVNEATQAVNKLDGELGPTATLAPIDEATRARAGCLAALTILRRAESPVSKAPGAGDALLTELSAFASAPRAGGRGPTVEPLAPSRDDRGVVVTLRGLFQGEALSAGGRERVEGLGRVAAAHPTFPVEVIVHGGDAKGDQARAEAVAKALSTTGGGVRTLAVGAAQAVPVADPQSGGRARNARVEIVFVTPESF